MSAKNAPAKPLDFSERLSHGLAPPLVHDTGESPVGAPLPAEPAPLSGPSLKRAAALKALRDHRGLFTAEAVTDRAARLKTL